MRLLIPVFSPVMGTWGGLTRDVAVANWGIGSAPTTGRAGAVETMTKTWNL